jgi:hypothetical protein
VRHRLLHAVRAADDDGAEMTRKARVDTRLAIRRAGALSLVAACTLAAALTAAGTAAAASLGYTIHNYSGATFRLVEIRGEQRDTPAVFEHAEDAPKVGRMLQPGDQLHVELLDQAGNGARLLWQRPDDRTPSTDVAIHLNGYARNPNGSHFSQCNTVSTLACLIRSDHIAVLDAKDTVRTISNDDARRQADTLANFCRQGRIAQILFYDALNQLSCYFTSVPTDDDAFTGPRTIGQSIVNCGPATRAVASWDVDEKLRVDPNVPLESFPNADIGYITQQAREAAPAGWVDEHTFKGSPRPTFKLDDVAYLVGRFPVVRRSGTFVVKFANTTWRLEDVHFDTPAPDRQPRYSVLDRDRTPGERQDCT